MAWIAVHQQVNGIKLRMLAKRVGCSRHEALGILVSLWMWGLNNADQDGQIVGADEEDVADAITIGLSGGINPANVVEALVDTGWIDVKDGVLTLHDWDEWQAPWYKFKERQKKDNARKREAKTKAKGEPKAIPEPVQPPEKPEKKPPKAEKPVRSLADDLSDEEIIAGVKLEREIIPGIEKVCREVGMGFSVYDDKTVRGLLQTYSADEITKAISIAARYGKEKTNWMYIEGILRNGSTDGNSREANSSAQVRTRTGSPKASDYGFQATRL